MTDGQANDSAGYVRAWYRFCDADGRPESRERTSLKVTVGVTRDGRVITEIPAGVTLALLQPDLQRSLST